MSIKHSSHNLLFNNLIPPVALCNSFSIPNAVTTKHMKLFTSHHYNASFNRPTLSTGFGGSVQLEVSQQAVATHHHGGSVAVLELEWYDLLHNARSAETGLLEAVNTGGDRQ